MADVTDQILNSMMTAVSLNFHVDFIGNYAGADAADLSLYSHRRTNLCYDSIVKIVTIVMKL